MTSFVALGMRSEGKARKMEDEELVSSSPKCSSSPVGFGQRFLSSDINNLVPADFYLFSRLKSALKGRRYCGATDINKNATEELKRLLQNGFQEGFQQLYSR